MSIPISVNKFNRKDFSVQCYVPLNNCVHVPFSYGLDRGGILPQKEDADIKVSFNGELRGEQIQVAQDCVELLNNYSCLLLSCNVGFGKTVLALYLISRIQTKTAIVTNRVTLMDQWKSAIHKFLPTSTVCDLRKEQFTADIYIVNICSIEKHAELLQSVSTLIVDECHSILSEKMCKNLLLIQPEYSIGLSATPYRPDDLDPLLQYFFGAPKCLIYKKLYCKHTVYPIKTKFQPELKSDDRGKIMWNWVLKQQALNVKRNEQIVDVVVQNPERKYIILCKLIKHIEILCQMLADQGITAIGIVGSVKPQDYTNETAIIGTIKKIGVGFDNNRLNTLIIAADVCEYFEQYMGRVFRNPEASPVIYDMYDYKCYPLAKHFNKRKELYIECGGTIVSKKK